MRCLVWARGECPYRDRYGCSDADRIDGILSGQCVIELRHREEVGGSVRAALAEGLPPDDMDDALHALEMWLDAEVYRLRSTAWAGIVMNQKTPLLGEDVDVDRAVLRYRAGASERLLQRSRALRRWIQRAGGVEEQGS